jgi:ubiquinone/menaquinone biosynthesis C-methylase UbiE
VASIKDNLRQWNDKYHWRQQGDEWSEAWGGSEAQWHGTILPRIHAFVPAATILEIAPGFGRWSSYVKRWCTSLVLVDLSERCIEACRQRFKSDSHITYHVNDGRSLDSVDDSSVDFVFSFDSLVHAELDVIESYVREIARAMKPEGVAFIHHSNFGAFVEDRLPIPENPHHRAQSVSARNVRACCEASHLQCVTQEIVNWGSTDLTDVFSVLTPVDSRWARSTCVFRNEEFMREAALVKALAPLYSQFAS